MEISIGGTCTPLTCPHVISAGATTINTPRHTRNKIDNAPPLFFFLLLQDRSFPLRGAKLPSAKPGGCKFTPAATDVITCAEVILRLLAQVFIPTLMKSLICDRLWLILFVKEHAQGMSRHRFLMSKRLSLYVMDTWITQHHNISTSLQLTETPCEDGLLYTLAKFRFKRALLRYSLERNLLLSLYKGLLAVTR